MKNLSISIGILILLSGCAGNNFFNDYEKYAKAKSDHSSAEAKRIGDQAKAIVDTAASSKTGNKETDLLLAVLAMIQIERLEYVPLNIERPTTGFDVLKSGVSHIPFMSTTLGMYELGAAGINAAGNVTFGGDANLSNSFNRPEVHTTGSGNTTNYTGTAPAQVVDPVIVETSPSAEY